MSKVLEDAIESLPGALKTGAGFSFSWDGRSALIPLLLGDDLEAALNGILESLRAGMPAKDIASSLAFSAAFRSATCNEGTPTADREILMEIFKTADSNFVELAAIAESQFEAQIQPTQSVLSSLSRLWGLRHLGKPGRPIPEPDGSEEDSEDLLNALDHAMDDRDEVRAADIAARYLFAGGDVKNLWGRLQQRLDLELIEASQRQYGLMWGKAYGAAIPVGLIRIATIR